MASIRDLRRKIKSVKSTQKICKAMKAVATAKMSKAQEQVLAARPYARQLHEVLGRVAQGARNVKNPLLAVRDPKKVCYVVVTADRGLCGGFNSNILRLTAHETEKWSDVALVAVGRKARNFFRFREWQSDAEYIGLGEDIKPELANEIANFVIKKYEEEEYDAVYLVYSEFKNVMTQIPKAVKLLPVEPPEAEEGAEEAQAEAKPKSQAAYLFEPSAEGVLEFLLPKYVQNSVFQGLIESKASEHSARMMAMDNATKSAEELIDRVTLQMNKLRQESITTELLDIVGGASALE